MALTARYQAVLVSIVYFELLVQLIFNFCKILLVVREARFIFVFSLIG